MSRDWKKRGNDPFHVAIYTVRAELVDSPEPNPVNNSSTGLGELAGAVYLHSGEFSLSEVDLRIPSRGMDFELRRPDAARQ